MKNAPPCWDARGAAGAVCESRPLTLETLAEAAGTGEVLVKDGRTAGLPRGSRGHKRTTAAAPPMGARARSSGSCRGSGTRPSGRSIGPAITVVSSLRACGHCNRAPRESALCEEGAASTTAGRCFRGASPFPGDGSPETSPGTSPSPTRRRVAYSLVKIDPSALDEAARLSAARCCSPALGGGREQGGRCAPAPARVVGNGRRGNRLIIGDRRFGAPRHRGWTLRHKLKLDGEFWGVRIFSRRIPISSESERRHGKEGARVRRWNGRFDTRFRDRVSHHAQRRTTITAGLAERTRRGQASPHRNLVAEGAPSREAISAVRAITRPDAHIELSQRGKMTR